MLDWPNLLAGAVLGAVASITFAGLWNVAHWIWRRFPLRALLGELADNRREMSIFLKDMKSRDGKYYSLPDVEYRDAWGNIASVVSRSDVEAAADLLNILGQAGRTLNINWRQIDRDAEIWDEPLVCVGGNFKAKKALELCVPQLVRYKDLVLQTVDDDQCFKPDQTSDFAVIYRGRHPGTGATCFVVFGMGSAGTLAAGSYLRRHARHLGRLYLARPFAVVIRVGWHNGKDAAVPVWLSPNVGWWVWLFLPTWLRYRRLLRCTGKRSAVIAGEGDQKPSRLQSGSSGPSGPCEPSGPKGDK
jgi:hypothetical protein